MEQGEDHQERRKLPQSDVIALLILLSAFLVTAIAFVLAQHGLPAVRGGSLTDWLLVFLTASYALVSYRMLRIIRAQLRETEKSNTLTLRAWLIIDGMEFVGPRTLRDIADLRVIIRNVGKVPVVSVRSVSSTRWGPPMVDPTMELDIGPGCFTPVVYAFTPPSDAVLTAVHTGQTLLTIVARFTYTDVLGSAGETIFSARYLHSEGRFVLAPGGNTVR